MATYLAACRVPVIQRADEAVQELLQYEAGPRPVLPLPIGHRFGGLAHVLAEYGYLYSMDRAGWQRWSNPKDLPLNGVYKALIELESEHDLYTACTQISAMLRIARPDLGRSSRCVLTTLTVSDAAAKAGHACTPTYGTAPVRTFVYGRGGL